MRKRNIISIVIMSLLMTSFVFGLDFSTDSSDQEIVDNGSLVVSDPDTSNPITSSSTDRFSGEKIKSDIEFNKQIFSISEIISNIYYPTNIDYTKMDGYGYMWVNDLFNFQFFVNYISPLTTTTGVIEMWVPIYCGGEGVLTYEDLSAWSASSSLEYKVLDDNDGTYVVTSDMLDALGYVTLYFRVTASTSTLKFYFNIITQDGITELFYEDTSTPSQTNIDQICMYIDMLYFQKDSITNYIGSEYQYASDTTIIHSLTIPSVPQAKEINVYTPTYWTYSSINPTATVTTVDSDHTITSPTELTYEMFFTSSSDYLLALEDISTNLLTDVGFEQYTLDDYSSTVLAPDTLQTVSYISSEKYSSAMMTQSQVPYDYWASRKTITISNDYSTCSNYVAYVQVDYESEMQSDFDDIRFYTTGDVALDYELESYTADTIAHFWVNIGTANAGNNLIYMYYGYADASYGGDAEDTWTGTPFETIHHFEETSGTVYDSTSSNHDLTNVGVAQTATGIVGNGYIFSSTQYLYELDSGLLSSLSAFTISFWGDYDDEGEYIGICSEVGASYYAYTSVTSDSYTWWSSDGTPESNTWGSGDTWSGWDMITLSWDGSSLDYWINDAELGTDGHTTGTGAAGEFRIGYGSTYYMDGTLDEFRIARSVIDDDYIKLNWDLVQNQATEVTFSSASTGHYFASYYYVDIDFNLDIDYNGELYAHFDYYLESDSHITDVRFYYYTEDEWSYESFSAVDDLLTSRWIRQFINFQLLGTHSANTRNIYVEFIDFEGTVYLDNIKFFQTSTEIDTVDLDEYEISSTFISWDGYQNPNVENEYVYQRFLDRTDRNDYMGKSEGLTDENGLFTWIYEGSLSQKEYEIMSYAKNSWWRCPWTSEYLKDTDNWASSSYGTVTKTITDEYALFHNEHDDEHDTEYYYLESPNPTSDYWDLTENNIMLYDFKTASDTKLAAVMLRSLVWSSEVLQRYPNIIDQVTWLSQDFWFDRTACDEVGGNDNPYDDFDARTAFDSTSLTEIKYIHFSVINITNADTDTYIRDVHVTRAISYYFTPSYPYNLDYAEEIIEDAWDYSEGDDDGWDAYAYCALNEIINGYQSVRKTGTGTNYFSTYSPDDLGVDSNHHTKVEVRMRLDGIEAGASWKWYLAAYTPDFDQQSTPVALTDSWQIFSINLESSKTIDRLRLYVYEENDDKETYVNLTTDYVRLVHVEEEEHYITDNFIGVGSENDQWISAVYSDDVYLGNYADPLLVYYNGTIGDHTISWLPFDRKNEIKAYLYSDLYEYHYRVSLADNYFLLLNPPSFDVAAGLVYLDIVTFWGNTTYRCKDNSTWLGDAVAEGSSAWTFNPTPGHHVFTVEIYNGEDTWFTLTSSITIAEPTPEEELSLLLLTKDVDTSVSQVFINYHTNWGNTTLIVFDNSTQLGTELSGEGASIWSFSQMDYYAFHNISVCVYHDSVLQFVYHFSFTIQAPMLPDNYFILLNPPSYDIDAGLIYIDLCTYYGNCTYRVMMNESSLGDAVNEGSSVWSCDFSQAGFYNFTVYVYQGATVWSTLTSSITIAEPAAPEGLIIEIWNKDVDVAAGLIYINVITSWGNQSVRLQDNSTWLGDYASEGASIWLFPTTFGLHNISIWLYNDLTPVFVEYFSFTIQEPSLEIFTVHFDLFTIAGIGLPFETAKIYVNDSRIYNPQQYYLEDSFIEVKVRDYYNHLLFATNATITANRDIALYVRLFGQQIRNTYKIPIEVYFISTFDSNYNHSYVVAAEGSISVLLFSSSYHVLVKPLQDEYQNSTHVTYFYATTSEYQDLGDETKSYTISMETDLEPLDLEEPKEVRTWPAWVIAASAIFINAILISFIGAMGKWGIVKIWNYGLYYPNYGANWILRKFGSERELHWCVEHKGGLEFVTPEQYRKAEALKKEGQF